MNELLSQDKIKTEYRKSPALRDLPVPQSSLPHFLGTLQLSVTPPTCFESYPLPLPRATQFCQVAPPKLLLGCAVNR